MGVLLLQPLILIQNARSKSNLEIIYKQFNCTVNDPKGYITKLSCKVSKNSKRSSVFAELQFKKDLNQFSVDILIKLPRRSADFVLMNLTRLNGCQMMSNKNQVPFIQQVLTSMNQFSNFLQGCPYKHGTLYYLRGYHLDLNSLPAFAFETDMKTWFQVSRAEDILFSGYAYSRIQLRRKRRGLVAI
ncbi:uncharacterized protein LOC129244123 [Anastrepha obliqua]|uniref:uncharacterized protein LOC129244123 n=1 Tax=Anastrepha obliqua TaxID=95512 RepID=UPI00240A63BD|nr:uncharacterized protein LOC129244123 [Anastrepha obliqua]